MTGWRRRRGPPKKNAFGLALLSLLAGLGGCAGYQLGNQSLYPTDIQTVRVPIFQSSSFRRELGEMLTEAVVKEIEKRTPYKVVRDANADSVLIGRITSETKHLLVETLNGDSREVEIDLVVNVRWVGRRGEVIRQGPPMKMPADAVDVNAASHITPEYGQSMGTAQLQAVQTLAERIVNLMQTPW
jgi:hypothetical protein